MQGIKHCSYSYCRVETWVQYSTLTSLAVLDPDSVFRNTLFIHLYQLQGSAKTQPPITTKNHFLFSSVKCSDITLKLSLYNIPFLFCVVLCLCKVPWPTALKLSFHTPNPHHGNRKGRKNSMHILHLYY